ERTTARAAAQRGIVSVRENLPRSAPVALVAGAVTGALAVLGVAGLVRRSGSRAAVWAAATGLAAGGLAATGVAALRTRHRPADPGAVAYRGPTVSTAPVETLP